MTVRRITEVVDRPGFTDSKSEWLDKVRMEFSDEGLFRSKCLALVNWINRHIAHVPEFKDSASFDADQILSSGHGRCGDKSFVFVWLAWHLLGVRGR